VRGWRLLFLAFLAGIILTTLLPVGALAVNDPCPRCGTASPEMAGWSVSGRMSGSISTPEARSADASGRPSRSTSTGPLMEYDYRAPCSVPGAGAGCTGGRIKCQIQQEQSVLVAQRQVAPSVGAWTVQPGTVCLTPAQQLPFSPAQLQAFVDSYFQRLPLPLPALNLQPGDQAVVNLPTIATTDPPGRTSFTVHQAPFPAITITAQVSWRWDWGDGASQSSTWPGRAYDGTDPRADAEHYLAHSYTQPSSGQPVTVTAVWSGRYTVAGLPDSTPIGGSVQRTTTRNLPVAEYGATLTGN
jgi:hypothetical protein